MTTATPYSIPQEPARWWALAMAATVHLALFILLWIGIRWQNEVPITLEAEVWGAQSQEAAPLPEPVKILPPEPVSAPIEKTIPAVEEPIVKAPDIALEKKKALLKDKAKEQEKDEKAQKEKEEAEKLAKKNKALKIAELTAEKLSVENKRLQDVTDAKQAQKMRADQMRRITGNVGSGGNGVTAKTQDASYTILLSSRIKTRTTFVVPPDLRDNPSVEYTVELFPDGSIRNIKKEHASLLPGFDDAVQSAIEASAPFPKDKSNTVPSSFTFTHKPKKE